MRTTTPNPNLPIQQAVANCLGDESQGNLETLLEVIEQEKALHTAPEAAAQLVIRVQETLLGPNALLSHLMINGKFYTVMTLINNFNFSQDFLERILYTTVDQASARTCGTALPLIEALIAKHANITAPQDTGVTPLHMAFLRGVEIGNNARLLITDYPIVAALLLHNPNLTVSTPEGDTPLTYALSNNNYRLLLTLAQEPNIDLQAILASRPDTARHLEALRDIARNSEYDFSRNPANATYLGVPVCNPLTLQQAIQACIDNESPANLDILQATIEREIRSNPEPGEAPAELAQSLENDDLLYILIQRNRFNTAVLLINRLSFTQTCLDNALYQIAEINSLSAANNGATRAIDALIARRANINAQHDDQMTPLYRAILNGLSINPLLQTPSITNYPIIAALLRHNPDLTIRAVDGYTASAASVITRNSNLLLALAQEPGVSLASVLNEFQTTMNAEFVQRQIATLRETALDNHSDFSRNPANAAYLGVPVTPPRALEAPAPSTTTTTTVTIPATALTLQQAIQACIDNESQANLNALQATIDRELRNNSTPEAAAQLAQSVEELTILTLLTPHRFSAATLLINSLSFNQDFLNRALYIAANTSTLANGAAVRLIEALLARRANINAQWTGDTPLKAAICQGLHPAVYHGSGPLSINDYPIIALLLRNNPDLTIRDGAGYTAPPHTLMRPYNYLLLLALAQEPGISLEAILGEYRGQNPDNFRREHIAGLQRNARGYQCDFSRNPANAAYLGLPLRTTAQAPATPIVTPATPTSTSPAYYASTILKPLFLGGATGGLTFALWMYAPTLEILVGAGFFTGGALGAILGAIVVDKTGKVCLHIAKDQNNLWLGTLAGIIDYGVMHLTLEYLPLLASTCHLPLLETMAVGLPLVALTTIVITGGILHHANSTAQTVPGV